MLRLWYFLVRNYSFLLFLAIEVYTISLLMRENPYQNSIFFNSTQNVTGSYFEVIADLKNYFNLSQNNDSLIQENAELLKELNNLKLAMSQSNLNADTNFRVLGVPEWYHFIPAKVVNNTITKQNNFITINKGAKDGIKPEMGVISTNGIVGIVQSTSENYSVVLSLLNNNVRISAKSARTNDFGSLVWDGESTTLADLLDIPNHAVVEVGDTIETTSFSSIFPEGVLIGVVQETVINPGDNFYSIKVLLSTPFQNLQNVYVVENKFIEEKKDLETKIDSN
jgi:rod shape-determining protein MreC